MICVAAFERHELEEFVREWDTAFHRGEYKTIGAIYDDHAIVIACDGAAFTGRPAITEFWRKACADAQERGIRRIVRRHVNAGVGEDDGTRR